VAAFGGTKKNEKNERVTSASCSVMSTYVLNVPAILARRCFVAWVSSFSIAGATSLVQPGGHQ